MVFALATLLGLALANTYAESDDLEQRRPIEAHHSTQAPLHLTLLKTDDMYAQYSPWLQIYSGAAVDPLGPVDPSLAAPDVALDPIQLAVDCNNGSDPDTAGTLSMGQLNAVAPLKTLHAARDLLRAARGSGSVSSAMVTISGVCYLKEPLFLTGEDSATAWVAGTEGATISGGKRVEQWTAAGWTVPAVLRADEPWLTDLRDVPLLRFGARWFPRSRFPKAPANPSNGSAGWLTVPADATDLPPGNLSQWKYKDGVTVRIRLDPPVAAVITFP